MSLCEASLRQFCRYANQTVGLLFPLKASLVDCWRLRELFTKNTVMNRHPLAPASP
jgi:hypothetical protein